MENVREIQEPRTVIIVGMERRVEWTGFDRNAEDEFSPQVAESRPVQDLDLKGESS